VELVNPSILAQGIILKTVSLCLVGNTFLVNMVLLKPNRLLIHRKHTTKDIQAFGIKKFNHLIKGFIFQLGIFFQGVIQS
jgi:hypothetical protein